MSNILQDFDEFRKLCITDTKGKMLAKAFRKKLASSEKYANKLDTYFTDTYDGMSPERSKRELGL